MNVPTVAPTPAPASADAPAAPAGNGERFAGALRAADRSGGRPTGPSDESADGSGDAPGATGDSPDGRDDRPMTPADGALPPGLLTGIPGRALGNPHLPALAADAVVEVEGEVDGEGEAVAATLAAAEAITAAAAEATPAAAVAAATVTAAEADVDATATTAVVGPNASADAASGADALTVSDDARTASSDLPAAGPQGLPDGDLDGGEAPVPAASRTDASTWQGDVGRDAGPSASPPPDGHAVQRAPVTPTSTGRTDAPVDAGGAVATHTTPTAGATASAEAQTTATARAAAAAPAAGTTDGAIDPSVEVPPTEPLADAPDAPFEAVRSEGAVRPAGTPAGSVRDVIAARVAARVEQAVRALEMAPPPRDAVLEIEGMRLQVRLRGDLVRVVADQVMPNNWRQELASSLGERGFRFDGEEAAGDDGPRGDGSRDGDRDRGPAMSASAAAPSVRAMADDAMRM